MGTLYVVGTPIGNLEDITLRALRILQEVSVVVCEDTRVTKKLFARYDIHTPTLSFHAHSDDAKCEKIISLLEGEKNLALVTDAGTPGISDPGTFLIAKVRAAGGRVEVVPGASALAAAVSVAGAPAHEFVFLGFLPHKKGRETLFKEIAEMDRTVILYESPHRLMKTLQSLRACVPDRMVTVCRELTKIHEEVRSGTAEELEMHFAAHPDTVRGEVVLIISPKSTVA